MKSARVSIAAGIAILLGATSVAAQQYPSRPIRLVVPFPPGTASDFLGRTIGAALTDFYKVQVVVDNRPGAGGLVGTPIVLRATPDGHTIGLFGSPHLTSPMLQKKPPYDPLKYGAPLTQGADPVDYSSPEAFMKLLRSGNVRYAKLVKEAGLQAQ